MTIVLVLLFAFLLVPTIFFGYRRFFQIRKELLLAREKVVEASKMFDRLKQDFYDPTRFLRFSQMIRMRKTLEEIKRDLSSISHFSLRGEIKQKLEEMAIFASSMDVERIGINERFFQNEQQRAGSVICDANGLSLLSEEQIRSVFCDDDRNLIIAGAGSGKTRVIDFKVRYLVNHKKVDSRKIILLSFSKKSAGDLLKKISENVPRVEVRTIHSFSSQLTKNRSRKIFDNSRNELDFFVIRALVETLKDKLSFDLFQQFYERFFVALKPLIFYENLDELRRDLRRLNSKLISVEDRFGEIKPKRTLKTLKGEYVRSLDERYIADFLFLQNIRYEYEQRYPYSDSQYYPDFYLPEYNFYLEHFAIASNGQPPAYFENPKKYLEGIQWKRNLHCANNTVMIESYSCLLNEKKSLAYLSQLLLDQGVKIEIDLKNEEAYHKISRSFSRFFVRFYSAFKSSGLALEDLKNRFPDPQYSIFLRFFDRFLENFLQLARQENKMDFSDLIIEAIDIYENHDGKQFDHIIVDEFQDTSNLAMRLLNAIFQKSSTASFTCVGDDWQSIYGFNGSDVTIISNYEKQYGGVSIQRLNSNFRSHGKIVSLGKLFISKNPVQISKEVVSRNTGFKRAEIDFINFSKMEEIIEKIPDDESVFVLYRYNDDCPDLRGIFRKYYYRDNRNKLMRRSECKKNIYLMTIHASKGLEAQHVFILFPDGIKRKFPSEIEDHFLFDMLKTQSDNYPFSEERRLMYVAITRAEQNLYFVSPGKGLDPNSVFWDELKTIANDIQN